MSHVKGSRDCHTNRNYRVRVIRAGTEETTITKVGSLKQTHTASVSIFSIGIHCSRQHTVNLSRSLGPNSSPPPLGSLGSRRRVFLVLDLLLPRVEGELLAPLLLFSFVLLRQGPDRSGILLAIPLRRAIVLRLRCTRGRSCRLLWSIGSTHLGRCRLTNARNNCHRSWQVISQSPSRSVTS